VDQSISYAGSIPFQNPPLATKLYFNSYEIVVTSGNAVEGQGLLFFPYLMKRIPRLFAELRLSKSPLGVVPTHNIPLPMLPKI